MRALCLSLLKQIGNGVGQNRYGVGQDRYLCGPFVCPYLDR